MKAIVTDLDHTLLRSDKSLSDYTREVLQRCRKRGMLLIAASARPVRDILPLREEIGFDAVTATNGAVVLLPQKKLEFGIPREIGEGILAALSRYPDVTLSIETSRGFYADRDIPEWKPMIYDRFPTLPEEIILYKILASSPQKPLYENISSALTEDIYHTIAEQKHIQIMSREATKWNGVCRMLSHFSVSPKEAAYFGDDNDDIEPIRKCGLGVAVANAIPAVLNVADYITESNDEDGVASFIEEVFLR